MPELPTCLCVRGLPPYDRLTAIYQAAAELSGDADLPDSACVAGVPPFQRFSYIYEAFRELSGSGSLPTQTCVAGESPQDQVSRIYQAVAIYADDAGLLSYECVREMPIWQQWIEIYRALYLAAGSPDTLVNPNCVTIANLDVLSEVFCSLTMQGTATLLASFYIPDIVDTFERSIAAGYTGDGDPDPFQREAAVDVLRDDHYQDGIDGQLVILEDIPTECVLVAPDNIEVVGGELQFDASWDDIPVTVSLLRYEWRLDNTGMWNDNGTSTSITEGSATAGDHILNVRAISTSGIEGVTGDSPTFTVESGGGYTLFYDSFTASTNTWPIGDEEGHTFAGGVFWSNATTKDIGKITVKLSLANGSISGKTFTVQIYALGIVANFGTLLGTSDSVAGSDAWSETPVDFIFSTPVTITGGVQYHIAVTQGAFDGTNNSNAYHTADALPGNLGWWSSAGGNTADLSGFELQIQVWSTP